MKDNRSYYDDFASWYERERHHGYHALIDDLQVGVVAPLARGRDCLEIGCGTGLILRRIAPEARTAIGLDISTGMLRKARERDLPVVCASATDLPFSEGAFDTIYSFKVLAHVAEIRRALREVERVLRPGGHAVLEFYNKASLRYLIKRLKRPTAISESGHDEQVFTRYDGLGDVRDYLPSGLTLESVHGIRVFTPVAQVHRMPGVRRVFGRIERMARDQHLTARLGGFLVVVLQRR